MLLKSHKKNCINFLSGDSYFIDKVKLVVNAKNEIVLQTTTLTVLRSQNDDSFDIESLELSQKQHDEVIMDDYIGNEMLANESAAL